MFPPFAVLLVFAGSLSGAAASLLIAAYVSLAGRRAAHPRVGRLLWIGTFLALICFPCVWSACSFAAVPSRAYHPDTASAHSSKTSAGPGPSTTIGRRKARCEGLLDSGAAFGIGAKLSHC
jgi:hypothetical protein